MSDGPHEELLLRTILARLDEVGGEVRSSHRDGQARGQELARVQAAGEAICARLDAMAADLAAARQQHEALSARVASLEADRRLLRLLSAGALGLAGWLGLDRLVGWVRGHP